MSYARFAIVTQLSATEAENLGYLPDAGYLVQAHLGNNKGTAFYPNREDADARAYKFIYAQESLFYFD